MQSWPSRPVADSPAGQIIDLVARHGPMTVGDLVEELGVTMTAVREQVNRLVAGGWLTREVRRSGRGRPAYVVSVSDRAQQLFGRQFEDLSHLLLEEILEAEGSKAAKRLLKGVSRRMAEKFGHLIGKGSLEERAQHLADVLGKLGILVEIGTAEQGPTLYAHTCPYYEVAGEHREICEMEQEMMSQLVGSEVKLNGCMLDGHQCCEFTLGGRSRRKQTG